MQRARVIICALGDSAGTQWEVDNIARLGFLSKSVFINPGNNLAQLQKAALSTPDALQRDQVSEPARWRPPQVRYWDDVRARYEQYRIPAFNAWGAWFMLAPDRDDGYVVSQQEPWKSVVGPGYDLTRLLIREGLLKSSWF